MPSVLFAFCLSLAFCLALGSAAHAKDRIEALECTFVTRNANYGWLPEVLVVAQVPGEKTAVINDPIIQHFENAPKEVRVAEETAKRLAYRWSVDVKTVTRRQSVTMRYTLTIFKADLKAKISGHPGGYDEEFITNGTCRRVKV